MKKARADELVHAQGLAESRERAKRLIMAGQVFWRDGERLAPVDKPGRPFAAGTAFVLAAPERFVSRGGYKLLTAIETFALDPKGLVCCDVGASTGGFSDCLLQHGAARVYAIDVGTAQLHEKLRADPRVISLEGVNMRLAGPDVVQEKVGLAVVDVSFISLTKVLPAVLGLLAPGGTIVALVKPQFELGPGRTDRGVVRDEAARQEAVEAVTAFARERLGLTLRGVVPAGIKGPKGNQEFLAVFILPDRLDVT